MTVPNRFDSLSKCEENGEKLSDADKTFMKQFGAYRTYGQQINYNAQAYCLDYQQYSIKYYTEHPDAAGNTISQAILNLVNGILGNKPASMAEMCILNKMLNGVKIKETTDLNYKPTAEEIAAGVQVLYIHPGAPDENGVEQVGHAYIVGDDGVKMYVDSEPNDCYYAVCSQLLEMQGIQKTVGELRRMTAEAIASNSNMAKVLEAEQWIYERYPTTANSLLFSVGIIVHSHVDSQGNVAIDSLETEDADVHNLDQSLKVTDAKRLRGDVYALPFKVILQYNIIIIRS